MENWQNERMKFYAESGLLSKGGFFDEYFKLRQGVRCVAGHFIDYPDRSPQYYEYDNQGNCRMITLPDCDGKWNYLVDWYTVHGFMFAFDERVLDWMPMFGNEHNDIIEENVVGLNAVLEIDTPYESEEEGAARLDFFGWVDEFNDVICKVGKILEDRGEEYNIIFSGNGIYIVFEGCYIGLDADTEEFERYKKNFEKLFLKLQFEEGLGERVKIHIDNKAVPWNDYMKIPFTGHPNGRMSVPIGGSAGGVSDVMIDGEWLKNVCYEDTLKKGGKELVNEVIDRAVGKGWRNIW